MQPTTRIAVTVTFLRMGHKPEAPPRPLPEDTALIRLPRPSLPFYRYLYATVGAPHVWWLRRNMPDATLAALLTDPAISVHVLYRDGEPAGFFELDRRQEAAVNLSYFGLMPHLVGQRLGTPLLQAAVATAWTEEARALTVNTCTADHSRALPAYLRAGFKPTRTVREVWDVPARLGLEIPEHLRS